MKYEKAQTIWDEVYEIWKLVNGLWCFPGTRRRFHTHLQAIREEVQAPLQYQYSPEIEYTRIYHHEDSPGLLRVSGNKLDRRAQNPKNCVTVGWILTKDHKVINVEGV